MSTKSEKTPYVIRGFQPFLSRGTFAKSVIIHWNLNTCKSTIFCELSKKNCGNFWVPKCSVYTGWKTLSYITGGFLRFLPPQKSLQVKNQGQGFEEENSSCGEVILASTDLPLSDPQS
jgi:hypothetical protein